MEVYGKTGTSHKAKIEGGGYDPEKVLSSFIGFVDGTNFGVKRKVVLYVVVDEPGVEPRWGGAIAAPAFSKIIERTFSYFVTTEASNNPANELN